MWNRCPPWSLLLAAAAACSSSDSAPPPLASVVVDPAAAATLELTDGPLAGLKVEIPAGAVGAPTAIEVREAPAPAPPGFWPLGRAVEIAPGGATFALPVQLTLPYSELSIQQPSHDFVVLAERAPGVLVELGPTQRPETERLSVEVASLAKFWAAERRFNGGLNLVDYLPFGDGNTWLFEGELTATMTLTSEEPNLGGAPVFRLVFETPDSELGFYIQGRRRRPVDTIGAFVEHGQGSFQVVHDTLPFLPQHATIGQLVETAFSATSYQPYGAPEMTPGTALRQLVAEQPREVSTPVGDFEDLIEIRTAVRIAASSGAERVLAYALTFARDVGPVAVDILGRRALLVGGEVGGSPIGER